MIEDAYYTGPGDPNLRDEVIITGAHFKSSGSDETADCESRLPNHPVPEQRRWVRCNKIISRSGTMYHAEISHGAAFDVVEVRVRGAGDGWSAPHQVRK
ncbi:MAG TPA: hypothetical protein DEB06_01555 [Phycisphaerales bacterium]|nr:hypothetical protein [Phycisphaerales bacterium]